MHCRTPEHFWSQFARPFIFVPASFISDHDGNLCEDEKSRISEILPDPNVLGLSSAMSTFPSSLSYPTSDLLSGDNLLVPSAEKSTTVRGRLRKARIADRKGVRRAEDIPEYKGQMSVDDLVEFINNGRSTSRKDSTKSRATTTRNNIARNDLKRRPREFCETGSKDEVTGGKVSDEIDADVDEGHEKEQRIDSMGNKGVVHSEDAVDLNSDTADVTWNDFTVVSRKRKGKTRFDRENSPNDVNLTFDVKERTTELNRGNSPNEVKLKSGAVGRLKGEDSTSEMNLTSRAKGSLKEKDFSKKANLTSQVNQICPQVERIQKLNGVTQSKALRSENRSPADSIRNLHNPTAQDLTTTLSRESSATLGRVDKVNFTLNETYLSSQNGSSISSQKLSQNSEKKIRHRNTHQITGGHDHCESRARPESGAQSLSTNEVASIENSETKRPASKSRYLCPPVVFTDRNQRDFEELVDISFGFDVQESESGYELESCNDWTVSDCSSGSDDCRCSQTDVKGQTDKNHHNTKTQPVLPSSDENNNNYEVTKNDIVQSGTCGDPEMKKMVPPSATLLMDITTCKHGSTSINGKLEKNGENSTKTEKRTTTGSLQNTASAKENQNRTSTSHKIAAQRVDCIASSKKTLTVPVKTKRVTNSVSVEVTSADPCATATITSLSSAGRPISIVAPNQLSRLLSSSGQSSCSGYGSLGSSGHSESSSSVKSECSSQSFCSSLVHSSSCHGSSTILGPCARAPVVKVAPMLVEKLISNEAIDAAAECKSSSYCEESVLEDDCGPDNGCGHESSHLLTVGCDVTKLESADPYENDHTVQRQELFSREIDHDVHNKELLLHKIHCDFVEQAAPSLHKMPNSPATMSDTTGTEVLQGRHFKPPGNAFHLLSAQIYLYKSYLDSRSDLHEVYEEVPPTHEDQDPLE